MTLNTTVLEMMHWCCLAIGERTTEKISEFQVERT